MKNRNTQPSYIFNRKNPHNSEPQNGPRRGLDFIALMNLDENKKVKYFCPYFPSISWMYRKTIIKPKDNSWASPPIVPPISSPKLLVAKG